MKALSIRQPWAWLIVNGFKKPENRTWKRKHPDRCLVHTGKTFDQEGYDWVCENFKGLAVLMPDPDGFERGGIVGVVDIIDCVDHLDDPFFFGPYAYVCDNAQPCKLVECNGQLGFFDVTDAVEALLEFKPQVVRNDALDDFMAVGHS